MKITLIGAGNVATNLGKALLDAGNEITQVYSRTMDSALPLAAMLGASPVTDIDELERDANVYILSVKDSVLADVAKAVCRGREDCVFLHTAGSIPMNVFDGMASHYGVLYPMQTFSKAKLLSFKDIPCFVEGNDDASLRVSTTLAQEISDNVRELSSEARKHLHLAAVFACNFVNHCYDVSSEILAAHEIPFDVMLPLIEETARKVSSMSPAEAQTGPATRYDRNVIEAQSELLADTPAFRRIYEDMSLSIHQQAIRRKQGL